MKPPLVIDTCALRDKAFWKWLRDYHGRKVLPAVAYAEFSVYLVNQKQRLQQEVDDLIRSMGIDVEWYRHIEAHHTVEIASINDDFSINARDHMIASHAYFPPWIVVTNNVTDFTFLRDRVKTPNEIRDEIRL